MIINGKVTLGPGVSIYVGKNAKLIINNNTYITGESKIYCKNYIEIGENCAISFNVVIMDSDLHNIWIKDEIINKDKPVIIKNNVWIGCNVTILKGSIIDDGAIVGAGCIVNKYINSNCIAAGNPCRIIMDNIYKWR
ncbi:acyltransferase [Caldicellulosiruptor owensensis]|uniref:acyltransferase n=1 Tax=Caldicellulosiruptor owensensis TaxID=55205 RepID=UPI000307813A|nr:acyltransferase [Caldicellulosiruptor owensensis]